MSATPSGASSSSAAPLFAALGDPTRLNIVAKLCEHGPLSISRLADGTNVSRQAITKHLHSLCSAGIARSERSGRESLWLLEPARLAEAQQYLERIAARWDQVLGRLRLYLDEDQS